MKKLLALLLLCTCLGFSHTAHTAPITVQNYCQVAFVIQNTDTGEWGEPSTLDIYPPWIYTGDADDGNYGSQVATFYMSTVSSSENLIRPIKFYTLFAYETSEDTFELVPFDAPTIPMDALFTSEGNSLTPLAYYDSGSFEFDGYIYTVNLGLRFNEGSFEMYTDPTTGLVSYHTSQEIAGDFSAQVYFDLNISYEAIDSATPTPEPATMLLTGLGFAGLGSLARRRRARQQSESK